MNKLSNAIYEIHSIDELANKDQWVNRIHPLVKLLITVFYIVMVVSFHKYQLEGIIGMVIYPIILFVIGDISFTDSLGRLRIVLPLICVVGIWNPFFDRNPILIFAGISISGGAISFLTLCLKGILAVFASYLLIVTTSIEKICYAMRLLHIPKLFVTQILFIYRYVTVLLEEANRIMQAYSLRAPNQKGIHFKVWGSLIGQLLLRSVDKAEIIYESMCLRGYVGEFDHIPVVKVRWSDIFYFIGWLSFFAVMRLVPVFELIGNLVI